MPKFSFDKRSLGRPSESEADMCGPEPIGALQAFVSFRPGIEAIKEIARLANIEWSETSGH